jgi:hypothetical protein
MDAANLDKPVEVLVNCLVDWGVYLGVSYHTAKAVGLYLSSSTGASKKLLP